MTRRSADVPGDKGSIESGGSSVSDHTVRLDADIDKAIATAATEIRQALQDEAAGTISHTTARFAALRRAKEICHLIHQTGPESKHSKAHARSHGHPYPDIYGENMYRSLSREEWKARQERKKR